MAASVLPKARRCIAAPTSSRPQFWLCPSVRLCIPRNSRPARGTRRTDSVPQSDAAARRASTTWPTTGRRARQPKCRFQVPRSDSFRRPEMVNERPIDDAITASLVEGAGGPIAGLRGYRRFANAVVRHPAVRRGHESAADSPPSRVFMDRNQPDGARWRMGRDGRYAVGASVCRSCDENGVGNLVSRAALDPSSIQSLRTRRTDSVAHLF
jgi:hypothetical protein